MADNFDFGFTAVDQDELTTKTGESAALNEKIAEDLKKVAESSKGAVNSEQIEDHLITTLDYYLYIIAGFEYTNFFKNKLNLKVVSSLSEILTFEKNVIKKTEGIFSNKILINFLVFLGLL